MPAHVRTMLTATSLHMPVLAGRMALGTWQAIYLIEHRRRPHARDVVLQRRAAIAAGRALAPPGRETNDLTKKTGRGAIRGRLDVIRDSVRRRAAGTAQLEEDADDHGDRSADDRVPEAGVDVAGRGHDGEGGRRQQAAEPAVADVTGEAIPAGLVGDEKLSEADAPGSDYSAQLCQDWEAEALRAEALGVRVCQLRTGIVLGSKGPAGGGALAQMLPAFKLGGGGPMGSGQQWMSWVHRADLIALIRFLIEHDSAQGPFNGTAPEPVRNGEFAKTLGRVLHRPAILPMPGFMLKLIVGEMAEKIQAMSMEAKASAAIIGSLPPIVMVLVYLSTPDYISLLWTHPTGRLMLAGSALWMSAGIFVMKKMINFDF
eukprot:gene33631-45043_t